MAPAEDSAASASPVEAREETGYTREDIRESAPGSRLAVGRDAEEHRRLRAARRHELGRPAVTEHEIGRRRFLVAEVEPLDVDGVRTMQVGSALWFLALMGLLPFVDVLRDTGRGWWLATCLAGAVLGLIGWEYCRRRRKALLADPRRRRTEKSELGPFG